MKGEEVIKEILNQDVLGWKALRLQVKSTLSSQNNQWKKIHTKAHYFKMFRTSVKKRKINALCRRIRILMAALGARRQGSEVFQILQEMIFNQILCSAKLAVMCEEGSI